MFKYINTSLVCAMCHSSLFGICHTHKRYNLYNSELVHLEFVPMAYPKITLVVRNSLVVWTVMTKGFYYVLECMGIMMKPLRGSLIKATSFSWNARHFFWEKTCTYIYIYHVKKIKQASFGFGLEQCAVDPELCHQVV